MSIAVLSLTMNRLEFTKHCFETLEDCAGIHFDHYVLDQGSSDGTALWLLDECPATTCFLEENVGISRGMNTLVQFAVEEGPYDWYVKFDNDCELTQPDTLKRLIAINADDWILSPVVHGITNPLEHGDPVILGGERVGPLGQIGGIFMLIPGFLFNSGWRYNPENPKWGWDDVQLSMYWRESGRKLGYALDLNVNHYETSQGQWERYPEYFRRKEEEDGMPESVRLSH